MSVDDRALFKGQKTKRAPLARRPAAPFSTEEKIGESQ
jgi:hypothetical protein